MDSLLQDLRFGARALSRNPGFTAVALLILALGIGANASIFSVLNGVLFRPLPWAEPDRAVMIWSRWTAFDKTWVSDGEVNDYRTRARTVTEIAAWSDNPVNLTGDGEPERVSASAVTANLFSTLGVAPFRGRVFTEADGPRVAIIGYGLWQRRYGGDPAMIGRRIQINGTTYETIGIMPPDFVLPTDFQNPAPTVIWLPAQWDRTSRDHGSHGYYAAARLKPGATLEQARQEFHDIAHAWTIEGLYPPQMQFDTVVVSLRDEVVGTVRRAIWLLFGAVVFLLLIACANVANLLLARAEARQREIAVRAALGAGRARMLRQLLTEGAVLASLSAAVGLALSWAGVRLLASWNPAGIPRLAQVGVDARVLGFTAGAALLTALIFSAAPAIRLLRTDLAESMKEGSGNVTTAAARQRFRNFLVIAELALAVVLLTGAGLMLRTLMSLQHVDLGFNPSGVLTLRVSLPQTSYPTTEQVVDFYTRLLDRVRALPNVDSAGAARSLPLGSTIGDFGLAVDGYVPPPGTNAKGDWQIVTDGYLEAMGEQIVRGRGIERTDTSGAQLVALVNEEMARRYWSGRDPIGGRLRIGRNPNRPWLTVVGVVKDVRHNGVAAIVKEKFYVPHTQWHKSVGNPIRAMSIVVRTGGNPAALAGPIREAIRQIDGTLPIADMRPMTDVVGAALSAPRFTSVLLGSFALLALTLSGVGIFGVLSYLVSRRTREIGIRVAIGASRGRVLRMVVGSGLALATAGIVLGLLVAIPITRLMTGMLHGVSPADPLTFAAGAAMLLAIALIASLLPAWRATHVNPVVALKSE